MDYTQIIEIVISLLMAIIQVIIIPWIKSKLDNEKIKELQQLAKFAVLAAEQVLGPDVGDAKKQYAIKFLKSFKVNFDEDAIENAIEAAVFEMNKTFFDK